MVNIAKVFKMQTLVEKKERGVTNFGKLVFIGMKTMMTLFWLSLYFLWLVVVIKDHQNKKGVFLNFFGMEMKMPLALFLMLHFCFLFLLILVIVSNIVFEY